MDSLKIGFLHDSTRRDHAFTLAALDDAYRGSRSTSSCFRADAGRDGAPPLAAQDVEDELTLFDAISLEPEFVRHPILRDSLFLLDSAVDLRSYPWREGELDELAELNRVAALDIRAWSQFGEMFAREIPLLPAPLAPHRGAPQPPADRIVLIINDESLARRLGDEFLSALRRLEPQIAVIELRNPFSEPMGQTGWMDTKLPGAGAHVHIGQPPDGISFGRLIDTMNMRAPCIVFDGHLASPLDSEAPLIWRRPNYQSDTNLLRAQSVPALVDAVRAVLRDASLAQRLVANALREVAVFHEEVQNSLLPSRYVETYLERDE